MNISKVLNIVLIIIVLLMAVVLFSGGGKDSNPFAGVENPVLEVIHQRTSIRDYTNRKVSKEDLETIVRAGMAAPSAMNKQPWDFLVIEDQEVLKAIGEKLATSKMAQNASAVILVCGNLQKAGEGWLEQYWIQDCSAASQNILLAITSMGLGGVWTSIYPAESRMEFISELLSLPDHIVPLNVIPVGYPSQQVQPKDKWKPGNVHWGTF